MHDLVIAALQEGRIDGAERFKPLRREPRSEGHRMLFGDPNIVGAVGKRLPEDVETRTRGHRRGNGDNLVVLLGLLHQSAGEDLGVGRRVGLGADLLAGNDVELTYAMVLVGRLLRRAIAVSLLRDHVNQHRAGLLRIAYVLQHRQEMIEIVTVDGTDVVKAQLLEQGAAGDHAAGIFLGPLRSLLERAGEFLGHHAGEMAQRAVGLR